MPTWPTTPIPYSINERDADDPVIKSQFEGGYEARRNRWHRYKKGWVLTYRGIESADAPTQAIADFTLIRDFLLARRLEKESFTFADPDFPTSAYTVRYDGGDRLPQIVKSRSRDNNQPTVTYEMTIRLTEVF